MATRQRLRCDATSGVRFELNRTSSLSNFIDNLQIDQQGKKPDHKDRIRLNRISSLRNFSHYL